MKDNFSFQIKSFNEIEGEQGVFEAYANVKWIKDKSSDVTIDGAFTKSILKAKSSGRMPKMLLQHDFKQVVGVWLEMEEDEKGLRVKGQLALNTQLGRETYELLKMGALDALSIGYLTIKERYDHSTGTNYLEEVDIKEISIVTFPCNEDSLVDEVKSEEVEAEKVAEPEVLNTDVEQKNEQEQIEEVQDEQKEVIAPETLQKLDALVMSLKLDAFLAKIK